MDVQAALDYYYKDKLGCSQQNPNKHVVSVVTNGQREHLKAMYDTFYPQEFPDVESSLSWNYHRPVKVLQPASQMGAAHTTRGLRLLH